MTRSRLILLSLIFAATACGPVEDDTEPEPEPQTASDILAETELSEGKGDVTDFATALEHDTPVQDTIELTRDDEFQSRSQLVKLFTVEAEADDTFLVAMRGQGNLDPRLIVSFDRQPVTESMDFELLPFGRDTDSMVLFEAEEAGTYAILAMDESHANTGDFQIEAAKVTGNPPLDLDITSPLRRTIRADLSQYETELRERLSAGHVVEEGDGYLHPGEELENTTLEGRADINQWVSAVNDHRKDAFERLAEEELDTSDQEQVALIATFLGLSWKLFR